MYKVLKEKGNNANVILENTDTKATVIIGKLTMEILNILEKEGYAFDTKEDTPEAIKLKDKWELEVTEDTGKRIANSAMKMSKPVRTKRTEQESKEKENKKIDAMDVLLRTSKL